MHKTHLENLKTVWQQVHPPIIIHSSAIQDYSIHHHHHHHHYPHHHHHQSFAGFHTFRGANCSLFCPSLIVLLESSGSSGSFVTLCQFLTQTVFFKPEPPVTRQSHGRTGKHVRLTPQQTVEGKSLGHFRSSAGHSLGSDAFI